MRPRRARRSSALSTRTCGHRSPAVAIRAATPWRPLKAPGPPVERLDRLLLWATRVQFPTSPMCAASAPGLAPSGPGRSDRRNPCPMGWTTYAKPVAESLERRIARADHRVAALESQAPSAAAGWPSIPTLAAVSNTCSGSCRGSTTRLAPSYSTDSMPLAGMHRRRPERWSTTTSPRYASASTGYREPEPSNRRASRCDGESRSGRAPKRTSAAQLTISAVVGTDDRPCAIDAFRRSATAVAILIALLARPRFPAFSAGQRGDAHRSERVGPPPTDRRIEHETAE